jgi:phage shock protein A
LRSLRETIFFLAKKKRRKEEKFSKINFSFAFSAFSARNKERDMKETILTRAGRIIRYSIRQLIEAFEAENADPNAASENAVREIDSLIAEVRAELGKNIAQRHLASKQLSEAEKRHRQLSSEVETAIQENREDIAEKAIERQLETEAQMPVLESVIKEYDNKIKHLERLISSLQAKQREMKIENQTAMSADISFPVENTESSDRLAELDEIYRKHRIQERLSVVKARMKK